MKRRTTFTVSQRISQKPAGQKEQGTAVDTRFPTSCPAQKPTYLDDLLDDPFHGDLDDLLDLDHPVHGDLAVDIDGHLPDDLDDLLHNAIHRHLDDLLNLDDAVDRNLLDNLDRAFDRHLDPNDLLHRHFDNAVNGHLFDDFHGHLDDFLHSDLDDTVHRYLLDDFDRDFDDLLHDAFDDAVDLHLLDDFDRYLDDAVHWYLDDTVHGYFDDAVHGHLDDLLDLNDTVDRNLPDDLHGNLNDLLHDALDDALRRSRARPKSKLHRKCRRCPNETSRPRVRSRTQTCTRLASVARVLCVKHAAKVVVLLVFVVFDLKVEPRRAVAEWACTMYEPTCGVAGAHVGEGRVHAGVGILVIVVVGTLDRDGRVIVGKCGGCGRARRLDVVELLEEVALLGGAGGHEDLATGLALCGAERRERLLAVRVGGDILCFRTIFVVLQR